MDLKLKDVAELLNVSETTIRRWLADGKIPAYRLNHQYRFSRAEIEHWVMGQKMVASKIPHSTAQRAQVVGNLQYSLYRALNKGDIVFSKATNKEALIRSVSLEIAPKLSLDPLLLTDLLIDRERLQSTGIGGGIAIPHTRECQIGLRQDCVFIAFPDQPIEYNALDAKPVHTLFFLFAGADKEHLNLLAKIAHIAQSEQLCNVLKQKPDKLSLLQNIKLWEQKLSQ